MSDIMRLMVIGWRCSVSRIAMAGALPGFPFPDIGQMLTEHMWPEEWDFALRHYATNLMEHARG